MYPRTRLALEHVISICLVQLMSDEIQTPRYESYNFLNLMSLPREDQMHDHLQTKIDHPPPSGSKKFKVLPSKNTIVANEAIRQLGALVEHIMKNDGIRVNGQVIYTCKLMSSISGFRSKSTTYRALASGLCSSHIR